MGKGPHSTPVLYDGKLYTLGVTAILSCFDANSGELKWRKEFGTPDTSKLFCGTAFSPVVDQGNLIVYAGDDIKGGSMFALDPATGKERWKWTGEGPGYASPIVVEIEGARQVVTMTDKSVIGVESKTGKLLWRMPWPDEWNENIVTPVLYKNTLIFSGVRKGMVAVQLARNGAELTAKQVWHNPEIAMYMNSPVLEGDHLFGMSSKRKGQYFCLEAATGKVLWITEGREGANAAILNAKDASLVRISSASFALRIAALAPSRPSVIHKTLPVAASRQKYCPLRFDDIPNRWSPSSTGEFIYIAISGLCQTCFAVNSAPFLANWTATMPLRTPEKISVFL